MRDVCPSSKCTDCGFRSTVFESLSDNQLDMLTEGKTFNVAKKGTVIAKQDEVIENFIFLRVGLAKLTRTTADGREQIVGIATPKDFVGLLSAFSSKTYQYSIIAIEDSEFCSVNYNTIIDLISNNGIFAKSLLEKICSVSDTLINTRLDLDLRQLRGRVAFIICYFANEVYNSTKFNLPISRKEIAELIDMRVENVVRILSELRRDNIIKIEGTTIEIIDQAKLKWIKVHG
ncbi:transcriptional regulator [Tenuifilaceae bacterium CYCD]|nr:transcriptional regulator [Tenuifilaceae bacterium CYCD]